MAVAWLASLFSSGAAEPIKAVGGVLDELFTSDDERLDKQALLARLAQQPQLASIALQHAEAQHRSAWVAGWRPAIGWACAVILVTIFALGPMLFWALNVWQALEAGRPVPPPTWPPMDNFWTVLLALLGLGGLRTVEKLGGKAK